MVVLARLGTPEPAEQGRGGGDELAHKELKESDVPEKLRSGKPVAKGGPPELTDNGLRCFGHALRFDGKILELPARPK
jgi:hypothetical protein